MKEDPEEDMELGEDHVAQDVEYVALGGSSSRFDSGEEPSDKSNADYNPAGIIRVRLIWRQIC